MRVFVAGGTGVLGQRLVPQLVARGHQVTATTTSRDKLSRLEQQGADKKPAREWNFLLIKEADAARAEKEAKHDQLLHAHVREVSVESLGIEAIECMKEPETRKQDEHKTSCAA